MAKPAGQQGTSTSHATSGLRCAAQQITAGRTCAVGCAGSGMKSSYEIRLCRAVSASTDITLGSSSCGGGCWQQGQGERVGRRQDGARQRHAQGRVRSGGKRQMRGQGHARTQSTSAGMGTNTGSLCAALTWLSPACRVGGELIRVGHCGGAAQDRVPPLWPHRLSGR